MVIRQIDHETTGAFIGPYATLKEHKGDFELSVGTGFGEEFLVRFNDGPGLWNIQRALQIAADLLKASCERRGDPK